MNILQNVFLKDKVVIYMPPGSTVLQSLAAEYAINAYRQKSVNCATAESSAIGGDAATCIANLFDPEADLIINANLTVFGNIDMLIIMQGCQKYSFCRCYSRRIQTHCNFKYKAPYLTQRLCLIC